MRVKLLQVVLVVVLLLAHDYYADCIKIRGASKRVMKNFSKFKNGTNASPGQSKSKSRRKKGSSVPVPSAAQSPTTPPRSPGDAPSYLSTRTRSSTTARMSTSKSSPAARSWTDVDVVGMSLGAAQNSTAGAPQLLAWTQPVHLAAAQNNTLHGNPDNLAIQHNGIGNSNASEPLPTPLSTATSATAKTAYLTQPLRDDNSK